MDRRQSDEERFWQAVRIRDAGQDGRFWYGVARTGIYCRPSCPAPRPQRAQVRFYRTADAAERDGLRACARCTPSVAAAATGDREAARIAAVCRYIDTHAGQKLPLAALAQRAGLSAFHFQRRFKAVVGLSPRDYAEACRLKLLREELRTAPSLSAAIYGAGYGSASRVYEKTDAQLGMTPAKYRSGGQGLDLSYAAGATPLGKVMIAASDRGICFLQFGDSEQLLLGALRAEFPAARLAPMAPAQTTLFEDWMQRLGEHLAGRRPQLALPLDTLGTAFQREVWKYLQTIPYGQTRSYAEVAQAIGRPDAARAVARACATNAVALLIPCHRVIRGDGALSGYRWGLDRKRALLDSERASRP